MISKGKRIKVPSFHTNAKIGILISIGVILSKTFQQIFVKLKYFCGVIIIL